MKKIFLLLFLVFTTTFLMAATGEDETVATSMVALIMTGVIGVVIFYGGKVIQAADIFDITYWWRDNGTSFIVNLAIAIIVGVVSSKSSTSVESILAMFGVAISGSVGTISFSTALSAIVYAVVKKLRGKGRTITDGNGNIKLTR